MAGILCHTQPGEKNICSRKTRSVSGKWHKDHRSCLIIANFTILLFPILFVSEKLWDQGKFHALYQLDSWKGRWMMLNVLILKINYNSVTFYQTPQIWAARKTHWAHINVYIHTYIYLCIMMYNIYIFCLWGLPPQLNKPLCHFYVSSLSMVAPAASGLLALLLIVRSSLQPCTGHLASSYREMVKVKNHSICPKKNAHGVSFQDHGNKILFW